MMQGKWATALVIFALVLATIYTLIGMFWQPARGGEYNPLIEYVNITRTEYIYVVVEKPAVVVYKNIYTRHWTTRQDFEAWWYSENLTLLLSDNCISYSDWLQNKATEQGYVGLSHALALYGSYYGRNVTSIPDGHDGLLVFIPGDGFYYFDPEIAIDTKNLKLLKVAPSGLSLR